MSSVLADLVSYLANVVIGRLNSIVKYVGPERMTNVTNALLAQIPDEIHLSDKMFLDGGLS